MKVRRRWTKRKRLGILHTASEPHAPSCSGSIRAFMRVAAGHGLDAVILGKDAIARVDELDGLLIRDLTSPRNHTYDFARAAEARESRSSTMRDRSCAAPTRSSSTTS